MQYVPTIALSFSIEQAIFLTVILLRYKTWLIFELYDGGEEIARGVYWRDMTLIRKWNITCFGN